MKRAVKIAIGVGATLLGLFALLMVVFFVGLLFPHKVTESEGPRWFRILVCDPMPESVTNLTATGVTMFTGKSVQLGFQASPDDLVAIVQRGGFVPWDGFSGDAAGIRRMSVGLTNPEVFLKRKAPSLGYVTLLIETNRSLVRVDFFRP